MAEKHNERTGILYGVIVVLVVLILAKSFMIFNLIQKHDEVRVKLYRATTAFAACDSMLQGLNWLRNNNDITKPTE